MHVRALDIVPCIIIMVIIIRERPKGLISWL